MKKFVAFLISFSILWTSAMPMLSATNTNATMTGLGRVPVSMSNKIEIKPLDYDFQPVPADWTKLIGGIKPAAFSGVSYTLAANVLQVNKDVSAKIASAGQLVAGSAEQKLRPNKIVAQGGYIPMTILDAAAAGKGRIIEPGTVVVDDTTGTAFKVVAPIIESDATKPYKNTYAIVKPDLHEVLSDFKLKEETINLTLGNLDGFAPNVLESMKLPGQLKPMSAAGKSSKGYKYINKSPMIDLSFDETQLEGSTSSGSKIIVTLSGGIGIDNIQLTGKYSGFGGYRVGLTLEQESFLSVGVAADIHEEVRIPLFGIDVPFGIGRVAGGLFVIVNLDGTIRLEIEAREYTRDFIGISGSTAFYLPVSFRPAFSIEKMELDGDVNIEGKIDGVIKAGALLEIELFGLDLVGAGAFLGAGLSVDKVGKNLDIEVFGVIEAYVALLGKHFRLIDIRPTILEKKQRDTGGYRLTVLEAFVKPQLVGGTIETQTSDPADKDGFTAAVGVEYRVKVAPKGVDIDDTDDSKFIYYPAKDANGNPVYDKTNAEGEFYQKDVITTTDSKVIIEIRVNNEVYECDPVTPWLPFKKIIVTQADYFSEFAMGQVVPVKTMWWEAPIGTEPEGQMKTTYYDEGMVAISLDTGGMARTKTDDKGLFDTRNPLIVEPKKTGTLSPKKLIIPNIIDIRPETKLTGIIDTDGLFTCYCPCTPTINLELVRVVDEVEKSTRSYNEGDKVIHQMAYDESIYVVNRTGTQVLTSNQINYKAYGYSTQDVFTRGYFYYGLAGQNTALLYQGKGSPNGLRPDPTAPILISEQDEEGNPTGTTLFKQRVLTEWVWQPHSNPVTITSKDNTSSTTNGGTFQVTAKGKAPLKFTLKNAPAGTKIDEQSGLMTFPANLAVGRHVFTIRAEEKEAPNNIKPLIDLKKEYTEDASPPCEQTFKLTITKAASSAATSSSQTPAAPVIAQAAHSYQFSKQTGSGDLVIPVTATGTAPISYSLSMTGSSQQVPAEITIHASTGVLTIKDAIKEGKYLFTVKAANAAGFDVQDCVLTVTAKIPSTASTVSEVKTAPVIAQEEHGYQFAKLTGGGDLVIPVKVSGSLPVTFYLIQTNTRYVVPPEATIDKTTGVLTIKNSIKQGTYYFTIKAMNEAGSDTQDCKLTVTSVTASIPRVSIPLNAEGDKPSIADAGRVRARSSKPQPVQLSTRVKSDTPLNSITIRNDHDKDLYSKKQFTTNGAAYVRWEALIYISIEGKTSVLIIHDDSPMSDHHLTPFDKSHLEEAKDKFQEQLSDYNRNDILSGDHYGLDDLQDMANNPVVNPLDLNMTFLDYDAVVDDMKSSGSDFSGKVNLGGSSGTFVTGKYFTGLQETKNGKLTFNLDGASVTFTGNELGATSEWDLFNFAFSTKAPNEATMLAAVDSGQKAFTFSFAHHGELPGMASFAVNTGLPEGEIVNVYKFDAAANQFTQISINLTVGEKGVVTYQNYTMSEYLITTQTIEGAAVIDAYKYQKQTGQMYGWIIIIGLAVVLSGAGVVTCLIIRKNKKAGSNKDSGEI